MDLNRLAVPAALVSMACGASSPASSPTMPTAPPTPPAGVAALATATADVDGRPGDEALAVYADGTVIAGGWVGKAEVPAANEYFTREYAKISVEVLDAAKGTRVVFVQLATEGDEDPPARYQLFAPRGTGLVRIYDDVLGTYGNPDLRFPGDGTVRYTEDGWTSCGDSAASGTAPIHEVTLGLDPGGTLIQTARTPSGQTQDCSQLSACPWIYVDGADGPVRVGEILRDLRGRAAYALQDLALPAADAGAFRVRVAEEEDEVTFLDEIYLEVDGLRLAPTTCATMAPPAYCAADHRPFRMVKGDVLDLTFELPRATTPTVFARGYYIPTPRRR